SRTGWFGLARAPEIDSDVVGAGAADVFRDQPSALGRASRRHVRRSRGTGGSGEPLKRSWHLLAERDDGPLIPSMAIEALVRGALEGRSPLPGARAAVQELELIDYEKLFANRTIYTGVRDDHAQGSAPLYARVLGNAWD